MIGYNVDVIGLDDRWCYSGKSHEFRTTAIILNLPTYEPLPEKSMCDATCTGAAM
jgi:hypothetical protein